MSSKSVLAIALCLSIAACSSENAGNSERSKLELPVAGESTPSAGKAASAILWQNTEDTQNSLMFAATEDAIEMYDAGGKRKFRAGGRDYKAIALIEGYEKGRDLVVTIDSQNNRVHTYDIVPEAGNLKPTNFSTIESNMRLENMCAYRSNIDSNSYVFLLGETGFIEHWQLSAGKYDVISSTLLRTMKLATEPKFCTVDAETDTLYVAEEEVGIWAFEANSEGTPAPILIDAVKFGNLSKEVAGLSIYRQKDNSALLLASNTADNSINAYDINADHSFIGSVSIIKSGTIDAVEEAQGLYVNNALDTLVIADSDNEGERTNFKFVKLSDLHNLLETTKPLTKQNQTSSHTFSSVYASVETAPVKHGGDAADDPAIWVHPSDTSKSLIIGTNKQGGLYTYTLDGKQHQYLADGKMNNVDIRYGFDLNGEQATIIAASNRTNRTIALYRMDEETGTLSDIANGIQPTRMQDPYGMCMYQSAVSGKTYVFINEKAGTVRQWELAAEENGKISTKIVREFNVGSTAEGCVADDDTGILYQAEEDVALWAYSAEPNAGDTRTLIADKETHPQLKDDLEGVSIYYGKDGEGYIIQSSQGNNSYAVFDRKAPHTYRGSYSVQTNIKTGIDGSSETDGLDIISAPLGSAFPYGLFIAQDGRNVMPMANQNFKLVNFKDIADALDLEIYTGWSPRK